MKKNDCLVIGMSNFGRNIAQELNSMGKNVTVIDRNEEIFDFMDEFSGFMVKGDATDPTVLESNGIKNAYMVVITTNDDNTNIFLAHLCEKVYKVPEIFCRVADTEKNILLDENIKIINPFSLCMDYFNKVLKE